MQIDDTISSYHQKSKRCDRCGRRFALVVSDDRYGSLRVVDTPRGPRFWCFRCRQTPLPMFARH